MIKIEEGDVSSIVIEELGQISYFFNCALKRNKKNKACALSSYQDVFSTFVDIKMVFVLTPDLLLFSTFFNF